MKNNSDIIKNTEKNEDSSNENGMKFDYLKFEKSLNPIIIDTLQYIGKSCINLIYSLSEPLGFLYKSISEIVAKINFDVEENVKIEMVEAFTAWGEVGWTIIPEATIDIYKAKPTDIKSANKIVGPYLKKANLDTLFLEMREQKYYNVDIEDAIFCFNNKKYKACALLLFTNIEKILIYEQILKKETNIKVTNKAVKKLNKRVKHDVGSNIFKIFPYLFVINTIACLDTFFCNANNFVKEGKFINRDFLSHGMNKRKVRKRDCIQLFLLLYNMNDTIKFLN